MSALDAPLLDGLLRLVRASFSFRLDDESDIRAQPELALGQIERQFGKGSVMRMSDAARAMLDLATDPALAIHVHLDIEQP